MKKFVSAAVAALVPTSVTSFLTTDSGSWTFGWIIIEWAYDLPLTYSTNCYTGIGPYYSDNIFTDIDETMHYEEYGVHFDCSATASLGIVLENYYSYFIANAEAAALSATPYKQVVWYQRPLSNTMENGVAKAHAWIGGAYEVTTGKASIYYDENAHTWSGSLWNSGRLMERPPSTDTTYQNSWYDPIYNINAVDFLPPSLANYFTE